MLTKKPLVSKVVNKTPSHILELRKLNLHTTPYRSYCSYYDALKFHGGSQSLVVITDGAQKGIYCKDFKLISTWL